MWVKLLTDLQILSCELHKNAFGGRVPPGPAGKAIALPPDRLAVLRGMGEREGERVEKRERKKGRGGKDVNE